MRVSKGNRVDDGDASSCMASGLSSVQLKPISKERWQRVSAPGVLVFVDDASLINPAMPVHRWTFVAYGIDAVEAGGWAWECNRRRRHRVLASAVVAQVCRGDRTQGP